MDLLDLIKSRGQKLTEFAYGINTGDVFAKNMQDCVGDEVCYRIGAKGNVSFNDAVKRAGNTLTYHNPDMVVKDIYGDDDTVKKITHDQELVLPKNTLMVFKHTLTTPKKDRDGDILRTSGAVPDPKMLLLWQHVHTLPIGKSLKVFKHDNEELVMISAIVDMNELAHDAAVMVDNDMGRFSHGFRAMEFEAMKDNEGGGFDVKRFEIMEESLVSVPANTDAEVQEIILDLVEGGKLTSAAFKSQGESIRSKRAKQLGYTGEVDEKSGSGCGCGGKGTSEEADVPADEEHKAGSEDSEVKGDDHDKDDHDKDKEKDKTCPKCGKEMTEGKCKACGYMENHDKDKDDKDDKSTDSWDEEKSFDDIKYGAVLSKANLKALTEVAEDLKEIHGACSTRSGKALCNKAYTSIMGVVKSASKEEEKEEDKSTETETGVTPSAQKAFEEFLKYASDEEIDRMRKTTEALMVIKQRDVETEEALRLLK